MYQILIRLFSERVLNDFDIQKNLFADFIINIKYKSTISKTATKIFINYEQM